MSEMSRKTRDAGWCDGGPLSRDLSQQIIEAKVAVQNGDIEVASAHLNNALVLTEIVSTLESHANVVSQG